MNGSNNTLRLTQVRISGSKKPISSLDDRVERLQLPNMGNSLCLGDILNHASTSYNLEVDISTKCNEIINLFWQSEFNLDLTEFSGYGWIETSQKNTVETVRMASLPIFMIA